MLFDKLKHFFSHAEEDVGYVLTHVSPFVLAKIKPILISAGEEFWKVAYPLAVDIVKELESQTMSGWDKHKTAVQNLKAAVIATGKFAEKEIEDLHLGQIILVAFANSPKILAALAAAGIVL
jgi:hypothetical protein